MFLLGPGGGGTVQAAPPRAAAPPRVTTHEPGAYPALPIESPYHGTLDGLAFGGYGELRFAEDREAGVSNPEWFSVGGVN